VAFLEKLSYGLRKLEESKHVRDGRAILSDRFGDLLLSQTELPRQPVVPLSLFNRIQIGSLEVFDEREGKDCPVVYFLDDRRDLFPPEFRCCSQTALTGDKLEAIFAWPPTYGYRLEKSTRLEAFLKLSQIIRIELVPRLKRVSGDLRNRNGL
jgi:hypothetical protein